jgi:RIO kinase 1
MPALTAADVPAVQEFLDQGLITALLGQLKSGKEAASYLCRGGRDVDGARYVVAKVYHDLDRRNFANDSLYQEGRVILNGQLKRAIAKKTGFGKNANLALWVDAEFEMLSNLEYGGVRVPTPYFCNEQALLMSFISAGGGREPAPQLQHAKLDREQAEVVRDQLLLEVEAMLNCNVVHGDLSPFNVLWDGTLAWIIDFPQAVDARMSPHARTLLQRDLQNLSKYFARHGLGFDAESHAGWLWQRWKYGELG